MNLIPTTSAAARAKVAKLERAMLLCPQADIATSHLIHAGLYARTIMLPKGVVITGALIKLATVLIVSGDVTVTLGASSTRFTGYHVIAASTGRKSAFFAHADTDMTMLFPTHADNVADAEAEFTDEPGLLLSRRQRSVTLITKE